MNWLGAGNATSAFTVTVILVLGVGALLLWYSPDDAIPEGAEEVPPPGQSVGFGESNPPEPAVVSAPHTSGEQEIGPPPVSLESDHDQWNDGDVIDTGPFIDADDDAGDYSFSPVSEVGEYLDPDAE